MEPQDERLKRKRNARRVWKLITLALTAAAVVKELRTPPEDRHWNGVLVGFVPYDLRFPTLERVKERMWNPSSSRLINPRVFGIGWTVNIGRVVELIKSRIAT